MTNRHRKQEFDVVVAERREIADDVVSLILQRPSGDALPPWSAGAHIDLLLTDDLIRQYSLCGNPADRHTWRIGVLRERNGRGGSAFVHEKLTSDYQVRVRGPRNHFPLRPAPRYVFIAGGIGITPILPMVTAVEKQGAAWTLWYCGRSAQSMAFTDELAIHRQRVVFHRSSTRGRLDLDQVLDVPDPQARVYCCGPTELLDAVQQLCAKWSPGALMIEHFAPKERGDPMRAEAFEIQLAVSGLTLTVPPDRSVLEVLEDAGVAPASSCTEGTCGTCETAVLSGEVDHHDSLLTEDEKAANDVMFVCVSRAACRRLVLDL